jgi:uncharacterized protein YcnI
MNKSALNRLTILMTLIMVFVGSALAHVTVSPKESTPGASEKYTFRVPTEKAIPTVRVELTFPAAAAVTTIEPKTGWKIESRKDDGGKLTGAIWSGSAIPPRESAEFSVVAKNPGDETTLVWKVIQVYEDGSKSEWTDAAGGRSPAPVTILKKTANK